MATDISEVREVLKRRLSELDEERKQVQQALSALTGGRSGRRGPGRPRGSGGTTTRRRRRRRGGTRADEAVKLVNSNPGITASGIAKQMKIKPNYLYRVLGDLQKEGRVKKRGREYHPAG